MCGIVGYLGKDDPKKVILEGLRALEYRGYDSAGVAIFHQGQIKRVRAEGKLNHLEAKLREEKFDGHLGIGHTRWATHGPPNERNAHPHCVGGVSIVHNGIIENYVELREQLIELGSVFESETDSELLAHLIHKSLDDTGDLERAVLQVLPQLRGAYSVVAVWDKEPDAMVAFKNGPPLVIGQTGHSVIVASDVQAIMPHTKQVLFLNDDEVAVIKGAAVRILSPRGEPLVGEVIEMKWNPEMREKGGFQHFMLKEIYEQPRAVAAALAPHVNLASHTLQLNRLGFGHPLHKLEELPLEQNWMDTQNIFAGVERIFVVACGTSFYAGMVGEYIIERVARVPVECEIASEFRYRHPVLPPKSMVVTISQSGETADTLAALRLAKEQGTQTLSICNVRGSSIDREAHGHMYMNAGVEVGVASTKAFSATLALLNLLAMAIAKSKGKLSIQDEKLWVHDLLAAPAFMEKVLNYNTFFQDAAESLKSFKGFLYLGRGVHFPVALEGALKLKELAYMHAEGYPAGEMKHGPLALIDSNMAIVTLLPRDELFEKSLSNLEEAKARGGQIIAIGSADDQRLPQLSLHFLSLPRAPWMVMPLIEVIPLQLLAYHVAASLGHDVDQPRNLAKSVTVE